MKAFLKNSRITSEKIFKSSPFRYLAVKRSKDDKIQCNIKEIEKIMSSANFKSRILTKNQPLFHGKSFKRYLNLFHKNLITFSFSSFFMEDNDNEKYNILLKEIEIQYSYIKKEKEKFLQHQNRGEGQNTSNEFEPKENYRINYKCLSYLKPCSDRIRYLPDSSSYINSHKDYEDYRDGCIDIYVSKPRDELISSIKKAAVKENHANLLLHGTAGIGKTHLLLDAVARLRMKYLKENINEMPKKIIFYFLIHHEQENIFKEIFTKELIFACFPLIEYEMNHKKENKLDIMFRELFQLSTNLKDDNFMEKFVEIHEFISNTYKVDFFFVLDQINEIKRANKKNPINLVTTNLIKMEESLDLITKQKGLLLKCASNNNQTMRENFKNVIKRKTNLSRKSLKLKGANFDEEMIAFKLMEKSYPPILANKIKKEFGILTAGIPLFVNMIPIWEKKFTILNLDDLQDKIKIEDNLKEEEKNSDDEFNTSSNVKFDEDKERRDYENMYKIFYDINDPAIENEIDLIKISIKEGIDNYIKEKVKKFKKEHYEGFSRIEKSKFKEVLMALENETKEIDIELYSDFIDYQLIDFDFCTTNFNTIMIRTDFPDLINHYKKGLDMEFLTQEELSVDINIFRSHLYSKKNMLAGPIFERIVNNSFILNRKEENYPNSEIELNKRKPFDIYHSLYFSYIEKLNAITKEEVRNKHPLKKEELSEYHMQNNRHIIRPADLTFNLMKSNIFFHNDFESTPLIDGGFIIITNKNNLKELSFVTYDATIGSKRWKKNNIEVDDESVKSFLKRYDDCLEIDLKNSNSTLSDEDIEQRDALIKVIIKLEQVVPSTIVKYMGFFDDFADSVRFDKHVLIFPDVKYMAQKLKSHKPLNESPAKIELLHQFQTQLELKDVQRIQRIIQSSAALRDKVEIAFVKIKPDIRGNHIMDYETNFKKYESK